MSASKKLHILSCAALLAAPTAHAALNIYSVPGYSYAAAGGYRGSTSSVPFAQSLSIASPVPTNGLTIANETLYGANTTASTVSQGLVINPQAVGGYTLLGQLSTATAPSTNSYSTYSTNPDGSLIVGVGSITASTSGVTVWKPDGTNIPVPTPNGGTAGSYTPRGINNFGTAIGYNSTSPSTGAVYYNSGTPTNPNYGTSTANTALLSPLVATGNVVVNGIATNGIVVGTSVETVGLTNNNTLATYWNTGNSYSASTIAASTLADPTNVPAGFGLTRADNGRGKNTAASSVSPNGLIFGSSVIYATGSNSGTFRGTRWKTTSSAGEILDLPANDPTYGAYTGNSLYYANPQGDLAAVCTTSNFAKAAVYKVGSTAPALLNNVTTPVANPGGVIKPATSANISYFTRGINSADYVVGFSSNSVNSGTGFDALLWDPTGNATELNSLVTLTTQTSGAGTATAGQNATIAGTAYTNLPTYSADGWVSLTSAMSITDDGWISGVGVYYDDDAISFNPATGNPAPMSTYGLGTYYRAFEIQVPFAVPEPGSLALLSIGSFALSRRRKSQAG